MACDLGGSGPIEYIDEAISPTEYDVVLTDINDDGLKRISDLFEIENLSTGSFASPAFPVDGHIFGLNNRLMVCLNCQKTRRKDAPVIKVWFLVDTGSSSTYLSQKTMAALVPALDSGPIPSAMAVFIQDPSVDISCDLSHSHFDQANVLGMQAMLKLNISIEQMNGALGTFRLVKVSNVQEDDSGASPSPTFSTTSAQSSDTGKSAESKFGDYVAHRLELQPELAKRRQLEAAIQQTISTFEIENLENP